MPSHTSETGITLLRNGVLSHYEEVASRLGLNPKRMLAEVGLSPSVLSATSQLIPEDSAVGLLDKSAQASGCITFGLQLAEARTLSDFGPISLLLMHQASIRSALNVISQYRHLLNEALGMYVETAGKTTVIREEIITRYAGDTRQCTELAVGVLLLIFRAMLEPHWRPQSVHFTHALQGSLTVHRRVFGCPIHFESDFNGLTCLTADMDQPNVHADAAMASFAQSFMDAMPQSGQSSVVHAVRRSVYLLLPMGRASVEQIAAGLGTNVRTLQRRLDESGVSFSALLNDVRRELAQRYVLNTNYPMRRVAEQLGYSNLSSFTRWFSSQFGRPPSDLRAKLGTTRADAKW